MKYIYLIFFIIIFLLVSNCATKYQEYGFTGGFDQTKIDDNTFDINVTGNGFLTRQKAENYLLRRCAEITDSDGYDYFIIVKHNVEEIVSEYTIPEQSAIAISDAISAQNNVTTMNSSIRTGQIITVRKYNAYARMQVFKGEKPTNNENAFYAKAVLENLPQESRR